MAIMAGDAAGFDALDRARADAESKSLWIKARGIMMAGAYAAFATRSYAEADRRIADGLAHVHETGRELSRHELLAYRAITELERGPGRKPSRRQTRSCACRGRRPGRSSTH
jgi:hypothetical protein